MNRLCFWVYNLRLLSMLDIIIKGIYKDYQEFISQNGENISKTQNQKGDL